MEQREQESGIFWLNLFIKRGDPDRTEAISGKNSITFLPKRGGKEFMNHIVIIGFMGSGKTRVGKRLAKGPGASIRG